MVFHEAPRCPLGLDDLGQRAVAATLDVIAREGLARLTLDHIAQEAGVSRATLYRRFPGKRALLETVLAAEVTRLRCGLDAALADVRTLDEAMSVAAAYGARELAGHRPLQYLLTHEPGEVLPHLCSGAGNRLLDMLSGCVAPHLCRFLPPLQARRAGEWLGRIVLSYCLTPQPGGDGPEAVAGVVREFVAPALGSPALAGPPGSPRPAGSAVSTGPAASVRPDEEDLGG